MFSEIKSRGIRGLLFMLRWYIFFSLPPRILVSFQRTGSYDLLWNHARFYFLQFDIKHYYWYDPPYEHLRSVSSIFKKFRGNMCGVSMKYLFCAKAITGNYTVWAKFDKAIYNRWARHSPIFANSIYFMCSVPISIYKLFLLYAHKISVSRKL